MSRGYSKITIVGNLGGDPEMRYTPSGNPVTNFSVAVNHRRRDPSRNDWVDETNWYRVAAWGKQAEIADQYLRKGMKVLVDGRFQPRVWTDQNGAERTSLDINADTFIMLGTREENEMIRSGQGVSDGPGNNYNDQRQSQSDDDFAFEDDLDDVPF